MKIDLSQPVWLPVRVTLLVFALFTSSHSVSAAGEVKVETQPEKVDPIQLSVPPLDFVDYPCSRPAWCEEDPAVNGTDHAVVVQSGPCLSPEQCDRRLAWMQRAAIESYVVGLANRAHDDDGAVSGDDLVDLSHLTDQQIEDRWVARRYEGPLSVGGETRYEKVSKLVFTPGDRDEFQRMLRVIDVGHRLKVLGWWGLAGTVLLVGSSVVTNLVSRRI